MRLYSLAGLRCEFIVGHPSVVWRKVSFLLWNCSLLCVCIANYRVFLLRISLYIYIYIYACPRVFMHLRKTTQHGRVCDSVILDFITLWKLSFLHMC